MTIYIKKQNLIKTYLEHLHQHLESFKAIEGLVGLTLNGGLSRGYGDHLSEVDITIFLTQASYENYKKGTLRIKSGICEISECTYDIKVVDFEAEFKRTWHPITELWDLSYTKVLYDPEYRIKSLLDEKLKTPNWIDFIGGCMFNAWWHYKLAGDIWIHREDAVQGHFMLNEAVKPILQALFLTNGVYVPHEKWLIHLTEGLDWLPIPYMQLLEKLMSTGDMTLNSLKLRQRYFEEIWLLINQECLKRYDSKLPVDVTKRHFYYKLKALIGNEINDTNFEAELGGLLSQMDPFFDFVNQNKHSSNVLLEKLQAKDMYTWHYDIVEAIKNNK